MSMCKWENFSFPSLLIRNLLMSGRMPVTTHGNRVSWFDKRGLAIALDVV